MSQLGWNLDTNDEAEKAKAPKIPPPKEEKPKEPKIFSVSEVNKIIKGELETLFNQVWIKAEISNFVAHTSGHFYFSLKDQKSQISSVMFKGLNSKLKFKPKNGMEVLVRGKLTVYEPRGSYQMFCEHMEPVGQGALQLAYEQLKEKLQQKGWFDQKHKKDIPAMPNHIGVVTSPTGAAVRDIVNVLTRRFKGADITIFPARVQGKEAIKEVAQAIDAANKLKFEKPIDVLIVGRGGGSTEDLWAFNEELVAESIFNSKIPVVSAVGHEVDFTISDFVADLRAPTPSAAAELVVKNIGELKEKIKMLGNRVWQCQKNSLSQSLSQVNQLSKRLVDPKRKLEDLMLRCDELASRLDASVRRQLQYKNKELGALAKQLNRPDFVGIKERKEKLRSLVSVLNSLSPLSVLERGYSITKQENKIIKSITSLKNNDSIEITLSDGVAMAKVVALEKKEK